MLSAPTHRTSSTTKRLGVDVFFIAREVLVGAVRVERRSILRPTQLGLAPWRQSRRVCGG